ncbi:EAL domain-containing protein [Enterobacter mori]|uniref:EAL domain-containing protein n=1 Tax=Enterobacter mori TaxID=539813 RepID=UPI00398AD12E
MTKDKNFRKITVAFIAGLAVTAVGTALTWAQVTQSELYASARAAVGVVTMTERLLEKTNRALQLASPHEKESCTAELRAELNRLAIGIEPVRMINIFRNNQLVCSSYEAADPKKEKISAPLGQKLILTTDDYISPGTPVMILRSGSPEAYTTVSISTYWSAKTLSLISQHRPLSLRVGDTVLSLDNRLIKTPSTPNVHSIHSGIYPFSIEYSGARAIPVKLFLKEGALSLLLSGLLGIFAAALLWKIKFREKSLEDKLRKAIREGEIVPWYQPIINGNTGKISGVEVLARWVKPGGEVVPPVAFIFEAERTGLIADITRQLMLTAANELPAIIGDDHDCWHIGFNVTHSHIMDTGFVTECLSFIDAFPAEKILLTVELTEREPFNGSDKMKERLRTLNRWGVSVALDDFGTGYANMEYLHHNSVDVIKIDRVFVKRIGQGKSAEQLLQSLIDMAKALDMKIVAEGVETLEQEAWLKKHGVGWLQGYLYSPPVPIDKLKIHSQKLL